MRRAQAIRRNGFRENAKAGERRSLCRFPLASSPGFSLPNGRRHINMRPWSVVHELEQENRSIEGITSPFGYVTQVRRTLAARPRHKAGLPGLGAHKDELWLQPDRSLAEAHAARQAVLEGKGSLAQIAARLGRCRCHLADRMRQSYLEPDIVSAILEGRQHASLTRKRLLATHLSPDWKERRRQLGFI